MFVVWKIGMKSASKKTEVGNQDQKMYGLRENRESERFYISMLYYIISYFASLANETLVTAGNFCFLFLWYI